jgi:hypothetical protein
LRAFAYRLVERRVGGYGFYNYNLNYAQSGATGTLFNLGAKYVWN